MIDRATAEKASKALYNRKTEEKGISEGKEATCPWEAIYIAQ